MSRVLVLGCHGMLGHKVVQGLRFRHEVAGTMRSVLQRERLTSLFKDTRFYDGVDADDESTVRTCVEDWRPEVIINCIGIIKQLPAGRDPLVAIPINALLPHRLARLAASSGARLIHFSTDCVFSGARGNYREDDIPDPDDLYGRTKLLGEVAGPAALTLRTSVIGRELAQHLGLVDWFLSQKGGRVQGFARAIYTGLTARALTEVVALAIELQPALEGVWQVSSDPISKYDLLNLLNRSYDLGVTIEKDEKFVCDRSLDSTRFRARTNWQPPSWEAMIQGLRDDETLYASSI